jgi:hypothetical protein
MLHAPTPRTPVTRPDSAVNGASTAPHDKRPRAHGARVRTRGCVRRYPRDGVRIGPYPGTAEGAAVGLADDGDEPESGRASHSSGGSQGVGALSGPARARAVAVNRPSAGTLRASELTTTSETRPRNRQLRNRPPEPRAIRAANRHAFRGPSAACEAAANAARSAAAYARCRAARTPPTVMAITATAQVNPISASIHTVPEPRSPSPAP